MVSMHKSAPVLAAILLLLVVPSHASAVDVPARPDRYVMDLSGIVDKTVETKLNGLLQELEQKTGAQFVILTIQSLNGEAIEEAAIRIAHDEWKLGQKGKDNGVLLLIALKDRKYRIEVGYGLEGVLPDSFVGSAGRNYLVPYFKKGDTSTGVYTTAAVIAQKIAEDSGVTLTGLPKLKRGVQKKRTGPFGSIFSLVIFVLAAFFFIRNPRAFLLFFLLSGMGGRGSWGGHSRGGFGGGGFGSFGGGGGGGFGGGGASGSW